MNRLNKRIAVVSYCSLILFAMLILYLAYFLASDNSEIMSNPYNGRRQDLMSERVVRGNIYTADDKCIAETKVDKDGRETRYYPYNNMFAHTVGYVDNGKIGIESTYNMYMLSSTINPVYAAVNELKGNKNPGDNVITSLDYDIQKVCYDALGQRKGAVVVMEPDTGRIIAMVSRPDFNPNTIKKDWETLTDDRYSQAALLNRASQGLYPPGSTFKLVTLIEYMRENKKYNSFEYNCKGKEAFEDTSIKCYQSKQHGEEDIKKAFAKSCNCAFATMGLELNLQNYRELCETLLFNRSLNCNFEYKSSSFELNKKSGEGEVVQTAIGQGKTMISPLHNAMLISMVANGGYMVTPTLVDSIRNNSGVTVKSFESKKSEQILSENECSFLQKCLEEVVNQGTAAALAGREYKAAGKTGSAEYDSSGASHAWFIGYAKKDNKNIAVSIIVEGAGTGSDYAVPIAKKIFDAYY